MLEILIYLDESIPVAISEGLKRRGIKALSSRDAGNLGSSDQKQLEFAIREKAVLVTNDADFLRMFKKKPVDHFGLIYYQQEKYTVTEVIRRLEDLTAILTKEDFKNRIEFL